MYNLFSSLDQAKRSAMLKKKKKKKEIQRLVLADVPGAELHDDRHLPTALSKSLRERKRLKNLF